MAANQGLAMLMAIEYQGGNGDHKPVSTDELCVLAHGVTTADPIPMFRTSTGRQLRMLEFLAHQFVRAREFTSSVKGLTPYLNDAELPLLAGKLETSALGQELDVVKKQRKGRDLVDLVPSLDEYLHASDCLREFVVKHYRYAIDPSIDVSQRATTGQPTWPPGEPPPWGGGKPPWDPK